MTFDSPNHGPSVTSARARLAQSQRLHASFDGDQQARRPVPAHRSQLRVVIRRPLTSPNRFAVRIGLPFASAIQVLYKFDCGRGR